MTGDQEFTEMRTGEEQGKGQVEDLFEEQRVACSKYQLPANCTPCLKESIIISFHRNFHEAIGENGTESKSGQQPQTCTCSEKQIQEPRVKNKVTKVRGKLGKSTNKRRTAQGCTPAKSNQDHRKQPGLYETMKNKEIGKLIFNYKNLGVITRQCWRKHVTVVRDGFNTKALGSRGRG
jgi:hypothetical protein